MITVAIVVQTFFDPPGGTEKQIGLLIEHIDKSRYRPLLCILEPSDYLAGSFGSCPVHLFQARSLFNAASFLSFFRFVNFLRRERVGIVYAFPYDGFRFAVPAARLAGVPIVVGAKRNQLYALSSRELKLVRHLNRWVDATVVNSQNTAEWCWRNERIPQDRIHVIYNGIDMASYAGHGVPEQLDLRASLGIPPRSPIVGIVANLRPIKALDVFVNAANLVHQHLPHVHFVIVGGAAGDAKPVEIVERRALGAHVHFLGLRNDIPRLLDSFTLGVLTSRSESFSNAIVEYLASGLPVVSTDVGGAREAIEEGVNGFVVPIDDYRAMADRILRILTSYNDTLNGMKQRSRQVASRLFSYEVMIRRHEELFDSLTAKRLPAGAGKSSQ